MFYIHKGELWLSAAARLYPEVVAMEHECKSDLHACLRYLRYVYVRRDNEEYWSLPPVERGRHVVRAMKLWGCNRDSKNAEVDEVIAQVEGRESIKDMISLLRRALLTDKGRMIEALREKVEILREKYMREDDDDKMQATFKSMEQAMKLLDRAMVIEGGEEEVAIEYLFEIPEDRKPFDLRIN